MTKLEDDVELAKLEEPQMRSRSETQDSKTLKRNPRRSGSVRGLLASTDSNSNMERVIVQSDAMEQHIRLNEPGSIWKAAKDGTPEDFKKALAQMVKREGISEKEAVFRKGPRFGENILHVACLFGNHNMIHYLCESFPKLAKMSYGIENKIGPYDGENCLHIAIVHADVELVAYLLERKLVKKEARAVGTFFRETVNFGETPLAFAVSLKRPERKEIIRLLIKHNARLDAQDRNGNTLLHLCVQNSDPEMYNYVMDLFELYRDAIIERRREDIFQEYMKKLEPGPNEKSRRLSNQMLIKIRDEMTLRLDEEENYQLDRVMNHNRRTPLTYAAALAKATMLEAILQRKKVILWVYGPTSEAAYPLDEIDTFKESGKAPSTALMLISYLSGETGSQSSEKERSLLLELTPIRQLVLDKWNRFGRTAFYISFITYVAFLIIMTLAVSRPSFLAHHHSIPLYSLEALTLLGVGFTLAQEIADVLRLRRRYLTEKGSRWFYIISWTYSLLFLAVIPLRLFDHEAAEKIVVAVASLIAWTYLLYYARGFQGIGFYVVILREMILQDFIRFLLIFVVFLLGFSLAFISLFRGSADPSYSNFATSIFSLFRVMLFDFDSFDFYAADSPAMTIVLFVSFTILTGILMLNLLIAMMNDTYSKICSESKLQWQLEWASIILLLERRIPRHIAKRVRAGISGAELGIDPGRYFVVKETVPWESFARKRKVVHIFRKMVRRIILSLRFIKREAGAEDKQKKTPIGPRVSKKLQKRTSSYDGVAPDEIGDIQDTPSVDLVRKASKRLKKPMRQSPSVEEAESDLQLEEEEGKKEKGKGRRLSEALSEPPSTPLVLEEAD